jgi:DNA ligase-1
VCVQYFEETKNANGGVSLRFPVFKELREEGKEVSYQ